MLNDIGYPQVSVWEFIRVQKHLVSNLHLKLPWSTLLGCRQSDRGGLAELNGVWALNLLLKQRDTKQQKLQASQTGSEDLLQRGFGYLAQGRCRDFVV